MSAATVKHLDPTQVELEISIPPEELDRARERAFRSLVKNARIPGFRPGKAPRRVFEAQYGSAAIEERAMDALVPDAYGKALQENDLDPVDRPQLELLPSEDGQPVRLRATVTVRPHIELGAYKGITLEGPAASVSEDDVERTLQSLRRDAGTLVPVDRPVEPGDVPTLDYAGTIDGVAFEGGSAEGQSTEIAEGRFIPGFADGIAGMRAGETKDVEAQFPPDYSNADLAGKTAVFRVTVHENKVRELPELDDAFAQRFGGEGATVASLRAELRSRLEESARRHQRRDLTNALLEKLSEAHDFPLPDVMVERETESQLRDVQGYVERAGITWDAYLEREGKSDEEVRAGLRTESARRVKSSLLVEAIARAERIAATDADVDAEVGELSRQYGQPREAIYGMLRENSGALIDGIVRAKTVEFLLDNANIVERAPDGGVEATPDTRA